jgi:hypothetical protein
LVKLLGIVTEFAMPELEQHCKCGNCIYWERSEERDGFCRRHAPMAGQTSDEVAHWPQTRAENGCGEGISTGDPSHRPVTCAACIYWEQFAGGLNPERRSDETSDWWHRAGHCVRYAPHPKPGPGARGFWRATSGGDACGDGKAVGPAHAGA